jgi:uncharacterized protein (TIGR03000 family)
MLTAVVVGLGSTLTCAAQNNGGHGGGAGHALGGYGFRGGYDRFHGYYGYRHGGYYGYPGWYGFGWGLGLGYCLGCEYAYPYYPYGVGYPVYVTPCYELPAAANLPSGQVPGAPVRLTDADVLLSIRVPSDATVWINGEQTGQHGPRREFVSSGLAPGRTYTFVVTAQWKGPDGQAVQTEQRVRVQGGERRNVDLVTSSAPLQASAP